MKNKIFTGIFLILSIFIWSQSNTAITSGSIGKCAVWDYPYTLYNNVSATQYINSGVNVTVDQNRNIGAVAFNGSGGMDLSSSNGITLSGSGGDIGCRWDINKNEGHTITNNDNIDPGTGHVADYGTFFTLPYNGTYRWVMGSGWSANLSGAYLNGIIKIRFGSSTVKPYDRNDAGTCGLSSTPARSETWSSPLYISSSAGVALNYIAGSAWNNGSCNNTTFNFTIGNAQLLYEN